MTRPKTTTSLRTPAPRPAQALLEQLVKIPIKLKAGGDDALETFTRRLAEDPFRAFEWAADAMNAAAERDIARRIADEITSAINDEQSPRTILEYMKKTITAKVVREARHPTNGSAMHTAMEREATKTWAKALESLDDLDNNPAGYWTDDDGYTQEPK